MLQHLLIRSPHCELFRSPLVQLTLLRALGGLSFEYLLEYRGPVQVYTPRNIHWLGNSYTVMAQVPNRSNMTTCLRKPLDKVSSTSRRPNICIILDDVPPPRESVPISRVLFRNREGPLRNGVPKSVPRYLDEFVTPSRKSDKTDHPQIFTGES